MEKSYVRLDEIKKALRRLDMFPTMPPFGRLFYRLIYDQLRDDGVNVPKLEQAFHLFLRGERRRHDAAARIVRTGWLDPLEVLRVGRHLHDVLDRLRITVERIELAAPREAVVRELILTEINFHLGRSADVISHLQWTISLGFSHPLVHFALGYNLYSSAVARHTEAGARSSERIARNPRALSRACREAIRAFERGLGDSAFDAQINWWIGMIWEMLGNRTAARDAFQSCLEADPEHFSEQVEERIRNLTGASGAMRATEENRRLAQLSPITDDDVREAKRVLSRAQPFPNSFFEPDE